MNRVCSVDGCGRQVDTRGWCLPHYERWRRHGDPLAGNTPRGALLQFLKDAISLQTNDCILWPYTKGQDGYGQVVFNRRRQPAHRVALILATGEPPEVGMCAAHRPVTCHEPLCVNPRHLRWATHEENAADRILDGTSLTGEANGQAKLTEEKVRAIRSASGTQAEIADRFGVAQANISMIRSGKRWGHVA